MRKMRKILSLFLVLAMTISFAVPMTSAAEFTDVPSSNPYYSAIQSLVARGIISGMGDGTFAPDASIKRSEFAKMIILSIGMGNVSTIVDSTGFPDVSVEHWAAPYIKAAYGQGIINGFDDGTFKPDENVTYEQAITMAVRAKSIFLKAEAEKIGYPEGYIRVATKYQMLKNIIDGVIGQPAKRGTIAKLMDNAIKVELPDEIGGIPGLENTTEMSEVRGQVVAIKDTSLIAGDTDTLNTYQFKLKQDDGSTVIYDARNSAGKDILRSYLGKRVIVYYTENLNTDIQYVSSINEQVNRNYVQTVTLDKINDYSNTFVEYDGRNDNEERISVYDDAIIVYNGKVTNNRLESLIFENRNNSGSIDFLCTGGEGSSADIIFFTSYTNWYVTSVVPASKTVNGEKAGEQSSIVINDESRIQKVTITKDDKKVSFTSILRGQILSVSESEDSSVVNVIISDDTVIGKVTGKDSVNNTLEVKGKQYSFTAGVDISDISLQSNLKLFLDAFGKVAKFTYQASSNSTTYGYLLAATETGNGIDSQVAMSILDMKAGTTLTPSQLYLADSVTINNVTYRPQSDAGTILTKLKATADYYDADSDPYNFGSDKVFQPVRYSKDSTGKINELFIGTMDITPNDSDLKINGNFVDSGVTCTTAGVSPQFNPHFKLSSSTPVVFVPTSDAHRAMASKYKIVTAGNAKFTQGTSYKMVAVDTTNLVPKAIVIYKDPEAITSTEWESCLPKVVTAKRRGSGTYQYEVDLLGYNDGSAVTYYDANGTFYNAVSEGDVVRVSAGSDMKVEEYEISAKATEVYAGDEYIRPIQHSVSNRVVDMYESVDTPSLNGTYSHFAEGDRSVTRKITLYAGVAFDIQDGGLMRLVKKYPDAGSPWTEASLTDDNTKIINTSSAKVVLVEFDGAVVKKDNNGVGATVATVGQILPYTEMQESTDKLVVYCFGDNARMIIVYRNGNPTV